MEAKSQLPPHLPTVSGMDHGLISHAFANGKILAGDFAAPLHYRVCAARYRIVDVVVVIIVIVLVRQCASPRVLSASSAAVCVDSSPSLLIPP